MDVSEWVKKTTAEQGLNEKLQDQETILEFVALIRLRKPNSKRWSHLPRNANVVRVEPPLTVHPASRYSRHDVDALD